MVFTYYCHVLLHAACAKSDQRVNGYVLVGNQIFLGPPIYLGGYSVYYMRSFVWSGRNEQSDTRSIFLNSSWALHTYTHLQHPCSPITQVSPVRPTVSIRGRPPTAERNDMFTRPIFRGLKTQCSFGRFPVVTRNVDPILRRSPARLGRHRSPRCRRA
jgi:hypothetical protein